MKITQTNEIGSAAQLTRRAIFDLMDNDNTLSTSNSILADYGEILSITNEHVHDLLYLFELDFEDSASRNFVRTRLELLRSQLGQRLSFIVEFKQSAPTAAEKSLYDDVIGYYQALIEISVL